MISVIIPARNEEKNLPELLESLKHQTYKKKFEIIIVDGKSKDRTREIARSYGCKVIVQRKLGISNARNLGWKKAKGNVLIFLEADHKVNRDFIKNVEKAFKNRKIKCARPIVIPVKRNWIQKALAVQIELTTRRQKAWEFPTIFRKEVLESTGGWDESIGFAEDREFPIRIKKAGYRSVLKKQAIVDATPVQNFCKLFKQCRRYGRNIFSYFKKTKDYVTLAGVLVYSSFFPFLFLVIFHKFFLFLFILDFLVLFLYSLKGFLLTKNFYAFGMIPANIVRGLGELIGMIESIKKKERGKL
jgi:cellulose synthase/poly-beta-1,6-N-acetylglucosamine synthase-like glycosyltransferase